MKERELIKYWSKGINNLEVHNFLFKEKEKYLHVISFNSIYRYKITETDMAVTHRMSEFDFETVLYKPKINSDYKLCYLWHKGLHEERFYCKIRGYKKYLTEVEMLNMFME